MAKPVNPGPKHHVRTFGADVWPGDTTSDHSRVLAGELYIYTADCVWVKTGKRGRSIAALAA